MGIISKFQKTEHIRKNNPHTEESAREQEIVALVNDLPSPSENGNVIKNYLAETRWLAHTLKTQPEITREILRVLSITKDSSLILGFSPVYNLYKATEDLYKAIIDGKTVFSENLLVLIRETADKLNEMCDMIEDGRMEDLFNINIKQYLIYLDKAVAGEIFNAKNLININKDKTYLLAENKAQEEQEANQTKKKQKNGII